MEKRRQIHLPARARPCAHAPCRLQSASMTLPSVDFSNPDDVFGVGIFSFFALAVLVFVYIAYKFMTATGSKVKRGERVMVILSLVGAIMVLGYALLAFVLKIII